MAKIQRLYQFISESQHLKMTIKSLVFSCCPSFLKGALYNVEDSPLGYRFAKGAFWSFAGAVISRGSALIASILVARTLGRNGFGELGVIQSTVGMFGVFAGFGLGLTATKFVAECRSKDPNRAGRILALSSIVAWVTGLAAGLALFTLAPWLSAKTLNAPHLSPLLQIAALLLLLNCVNGAQMGALSGFEAFKTIAKVNLIAGGLSFPLIVGGVYIWQIEGVVWGLVAAQVVNCVLSYLALRREAARSSVPFSLRGCMQERSVLWTFSFPTVLAGSMVGPVNWACSAMLVNQPNGYAEMGIFNAANQWRTVFLFLPSVLSNAAVPMLSERAGMAGITGTRPLMKYLMILNMAIGLPILLLLCAASSFIMGTYGKAFRGQWLVFVILQVAAFLQIMQAPLINLWVATERMWTNFFVNIFWGLAIIFITYLLLSHGALGLGIAQVTAFAIYGVLLYALTWDLFTHGQ